MSHANAQPPIDRQARKAICHRVRALLAELNVSDEQIAAATDLSVGRVRNVITGADFSPRAHQAICDAVAAPIPDWNVVPRPRIIALSTEEKAALADALVQLADLSTELHAAKDDAARAAIRAKVSAMFTPALAGIWNRATRLRGVAFMLECAAVAAPFWPQIFPALGIDADFDANGRPVVVRIGSAKHSPQKRKPTTRQ